MQSLATATSWALIPRSIVSTKPRARMSKRLARKLEDQDLHLNRYGVAFLEGDTARNAAATGLGNGKAGSGGRDAVCSLGYRGLRGTSGESTGTFAAGGGRSHAQRPERDGGNVAAERSFARGRSWEHGTGAPAGHIGAGTGFHSGFAGPGSAGAGAGEEIPRGRRPWRTT